MKSIISRENPHFKALKKLGQSSRERRKSGRMVLDGMHLVESLVASGQPPIEIIVSGSGLGKREITRFLAHFDFSSKLTQVSDALFAELAPVETPSGILAIAAIPEFTGKIDAGKDTILLDGVQDPGNLGSILRSAAAAGFVQVLLSEDCAHAWSPKVLRAGMGAHFQLQLRENVELRNFLDNYKGRAVLTTLDDTAAALYDLDLCSPIAWVFGNEGQGVRPELMSATHLHARIPMPGVSESLNVAAAAAICLFETIRQRTPVKR